MRTKALWREGKEMGSCGALPGGDAASAAQWRCCEALPGGDPAERCPVEMLRSAACLAG